MMTQSFEKRLAALEAEVELLKARIQEKEQPKKPWWQEIAGTFEGDPHFKEAMELGRKYRESLRPKARKKRRKAETNDRKARADRRET
jgi:hypothetical protein